MRAIFTFGFFLSTFVYFCSSDMYLHFPHGSNNRLNGNQANVRNANRLFNSQNNGKAGYNVGDSGSNNPGENIKETRQLPLEFFMSGCEEDAKTEVEIMWTNQHGTGPKSEDVVETQVILQYMCQPFPQGKVTDINSDFQLHTIRNGGNRLTQPFNPNQAENRLIKKDRGLHEPKEYYHAYIRRDRNKGLFTADQNLNGDSAIYTRQNANGQRRGLEVPEERDYYPYWGPTPWKDIAIMVSDRATEGVMKKYFNSPNYGDKGLCIVGNNQPGNKPCPRIPPRNRPSAECVAKYITKESCEQAGGKWTIVKTNFKEKSSGAKSCANIKTVKGVAYEPHLITQGTREGEQDLVLADSPEVIYAPSTVVNHNGMNMDGKFSSYKWKIPHFPSNTIQRCVLRIRYNITTSDVPRRFDASNNDDVKNNPTTLAVNGKTKLQLALNTAQLGRTFQDRTQVIYLKPRSSLPQRFKNSKIFYIGGMGKRGNIVQAYPAMEYRFTPERITVSRNDVLCFAWSGSNNNPNNAGEGQARSDRTNVCWVKEGCQSLKPKACTSLPLEVVEQADKFSADKLNLHLNTGCGDENNLQAQLNNAPASCNPPCFRITKPGTYCYMGTRNNNFSNRRHIGQITVT